MRRRQLMSMFHTCGIHYHALTVVLRRWQLTGHVSYLRDELPCSVRRHETMTTDCSLEMMTNDGA